MIVVVLGASGDLSKRKIFPALSSLAVLPKKMIGFGRADVSKTFLTDLQTVYGYSPDFLERVTYVRGSYGDLRPLHEHLNDEIIFFCATPPTTFYDIMTECHQFKSCSVVLEKPYANELGMLFYNDAFSNDYPHVKLILLDHWLLKPGIAALPLLKATNPALALALAPQNIAALYAVVFEDIGGEARDYFDKAGIVVDIIMNHMYVAVGTVLADAFFWKENHGRDYPLIQSCRAAYDRMVRLFAPSEDARTMISFPEISDLERAREEVRRMAMEQATERHASFVASARGSVRETVQNNDDEPYSNSLDLTGQNNHHEPPNDALETGGPRYMPQILSLEEINALPPADAEEALKRRIEAERGNIFANSKNIDSSCDQKCSMSGLDPNMGMFTQNTIAGCPIITGSHLQNISSHNNNVDSAHKNQSNPENCQNMSNCTNLKTSVDENPAANPNDKMKSTIIHPMVDKNYVSYETSLHSLPGSTESEESEPHGFEKVKRFFHKKQEHHPNEQIIIDSEFLYKYAHARYEALKKMHIKQQYAVFGQYEGYETELGRPSDTETFATIICETKDNTPVTFIAGKGMNTRKSEIRIFFSKENYRKIIDCLLEHKMNQEAYLINKSDIDSVELNIRISPNPQINLIVKGIHRTWEYKIVTEPEINQIFKKYYGNFTEYTMLFRYLMKNKPFPAADSIETKMEWATFCIDDIKKKRGIFKYPKGSTLPREAAEFLIAAGNRDILQYY